ncbi:MAG: DNA-binding response regulator, partial [Bacteroidales bacterium]
SGESKSPADVVEGIEIGANFFLKKPLAIVEIDVYVKLALKSQQPDEEQYRFGQCVFIPTE